MFEGDGENQRAYSWSLAPSSGMNDPVKRDERSREANGEAEWGSRGETESYGPGLRVIGETRGSARPIITASINAA